MAFSLPGNASLKGKRSIVRRIVDRTRAKFNVAVAEVADMDAHRRAVIGLAVVSNDARHANSMLDRISAFMTSLTAGGAALEQTETAISSVVDSWLLVKAFELNGERNRGLAH